MRRGEPLWAGGAARAVTSARTTPFAMHASWSETSHREDQGDPRESADARRGFLRLREARPPKLAEPTPEGFDLEMWLGPAPWAPYHIERCGPQWRYHLDTGGGEITDRGAHVLDLVQYIAGCDATGPVDLQAQGRQMDDGIHNCFLDFKFEYRYPNGIPVTGASEGNRGFKIEGETGSNFVNVHGGRWRPHPQDMIRETDRPRRDPRDEDIGASLGFPRMRQD